IVEIIGEIERARARPVLRDDGGIAREIFPEVAGDEPTICVVTIAGGRIADHQLDLLAGKRHRLGLRPPWGGVQHEEDRKRVTRPGGNRGTCAVQARARRRISGGSAPHSAARGRRVASRCATISSTCMTSAYLYAGRTG